MIGSKYLLYFILSKMMTVTDNKKHNPAIGGAR